jgi:hypothetical protein
MARRLGLGGHQPRRRWRADGFSHARRAGATLFAHATWRDAAGHVRQFAADEVAFTPIRNWSSPRSRASYPVQIEIRLGELSVSHATDDRLDDQELAVRPAGRCPSSIGKVTDRWSVWKAASAAAATWK